MRRVYVAVATSLIVSIALVSPANGTGTKPSSEKRTRDLIAKIGIGEKAQVKVKLVDNRTVEGYVSEANDEFFVVTDKNGNKELIRYRQVQTAKPKNSTKHDIIFIAVIVAIIAVPLVVLSRIKE